MSSEWLPAALNLGDGETPFPWQEHLLAMFKRGEIPDALDMPTGLGKTAVMAIWLVARAEGAILPRRLVYIVDRRVVVDQATDVAMTLRDLVERQPRLKVQLGLRPDQSLPISTLRGQHVDNRDWLEDPASAAIIVGTVDMIGSRLLFEGYGISRKMRPYHAALLGADCLVVLDEAHLVPPFESLLRSIAAGESVYGPNDESLRGIVPAIRLLTLSATGRTVSEQSLGLTGEDLANPVVRKRLDAAKHLTLSLLQIVNGADPKMALIAALAQEAWKILKGPPARVVVFSDSREVAEKARSAVHTLAKDANVPVSTELFVGSRRAYERDLAKQRLVELGFIPATPQKCERPTCLFATSAAEVGVDLDADHMVGDLVPWERMIQRLGRVNRRGNGSATVVVVVGEPTPDKRTQKAVDKQRSGAELTDKDRKTAEAFERRVTLWKQYQRPYDLLPRVGDFLDASPRALRNVQERALTDSDVRLLLRAATTQVPLHPPLNRALIEGWSMTSLKEHAGRPRITPWLRGWLDDDPPQTAVVWRSHLPTRRGAGVRDSEIERFFEAAPPHASEILEAESFRVADWLKERGHRLLHNGSGDPSLPARDDLVAVALSPAGDTLQRFSLQALANADAADLMAAIGNTTVIIDWRLGGLRDDGLLDATVAAAPQVADNGEPFSKETVGFRIRLLDAANATPNKDSNWIVREQFATRVDAEGKPEELLLIEKWRTDAATEDDRSSSRLQFLDEHQIWAEQNARHLGQQLGLRDEYTNMLALVARVHDEGKRASSWQRAFNAPLTPPNGIYAKTPGPINFRRLGGYRHEFGSLLASLQRDTLVSLPADVGDLALHLIVSHHGFARPTIATTGCNDAPPSMLEVQARDVTLRFARLQRRWGVWGLAWWEALVRASDQQASRDNVAKEAFSVAAAAR